MTRPEAFFIAVSPDVWFTSAYKQLAYRGVAHYAYKERSAFLCGTSANPIAVYKRAFGATEKSRPSEPGGRVAEFRIQGPRGATGYPGALAALILHAVGEPDAGRDLAADDAVAARHAADEAGKAMSRRASMGPASFGVAIPR